MRSFGAGAPLQVEGTVKKDTTWTGDVLVAGDALVPEGVTLTVAPGTRVMFVSSESSKIEPMFLSMQTELMVRGTLVAEGAPDRPVTFGPAPEGMNTKKPGRGDWGGVIFDGEASGKSRIKYARFTMADAAVTAFNSSPELVGCAIEDSRYGVVSMGASRPRLTGCTITGGGFGVVSGRGSRPAVEGCRVEKNEHDFLFRD